MGLPFYYDLTTKRQDGEENRTQILQIKKSAQITGLICVDLVNLRPNCFTQAAPGLSIAV
jgi:hypothetical protein